jgi:hypothetical protein
MVCRHQDTQPCRRGFFITDKLIGWGLLKGGPFRFLRDHWCGRWSGSSYDVAVWHTKNHLRMAGPVGEEIWKSEGFKSYLDRRGGHHDFIINVYSALRDRRCFPLMVDLIAQTSFIPPTDREFGHYGPLPADDSLFDLDNWRVDIE